MYVKQSLSNGKPYLSIVQGYRVDGKVRQKTIQKLGYLEDLNKEFEDPVAHFKEVAKNMNAQLPERESLDIDTSTKLQDSTNNRKNLGYCFPKILYTQLGLHKFFQSKQASLDLEYNLNHIFSQLVFNRFLFPASKRGAYTDAKQRFFEPAGYSLDHVYKALTQFYRLSPELQQHLHQQVQKLVGRDTSTGYYDVTNYYFEIPYNDPDETDEATGNAKVGFRHKGPSKEHRPDPIVQMGLLMDKNGLPMAFNLFSGGESEKTSLLPTIRRVKADYGIRRMIVVADRGLNTSDNTAFLSGVNHDDSHGQDGYVYGQSVLGADSEFRAWVLGGGYKTEKVKDEHGNLVDFMHKSRIYAKEVQLKGLDGKRNKALIIYQKQMVYYSQKYADKQAKDREIILNKARDLIAHPGKYTRATAYGAAGYIRNIAFDRKTGEVVNGRELSLDLTRIEEEKKYDGYYSIVTSEKRLSDKSIRDIYRGLWRIEESFKIMKSEFRSRPIFVRTREHIHAHFLICFVALLLMRMLEQKLEGKYSFHAIRQSLMHYNCSWVERNYYLFDYRDEIIVALEKRFGLDLSWKYMTLAEIKRILEYKPHEVKK